MAEQPVSLAATVTEGHSWHLLIPCVADDDDDDVIVMSPCALGGLCPTGSSKEVTCMLVACVILTHT